MKGNLNDLNYGPTDVTGSEDKHRRSIKNDVIFLHIKRCIYAG